MTFLITHRCMLFLSALSIWLPNVVAADPIRITHNQPFPPLSELKNGKSEGLMIDVLRAASARVGLELEFVAAPLEQMQLTLKDGRADALLSGMTPERLRLYDFSSQGWQPAARCLCVRRVRRPRI
jgi:ABC-type amino acid transport substrate-binding protein